MPTYDYECEACGTTFERFQTITEPPVRRCPSCKRQRVRRLIGAGAGLLFKGSGFYITDYRSPEYQAKAKAESGAAPAATPKGDGPAKPTAAAKEKPSKHAAKQGE